MNKYLITYDLKTSPASSYDSLYKEIKASGTNWWHYLDSTWVIKSSLEAKAINKKLIAHLKQGDRIFIVKIETSSMDGWLPKEAWDWLKKDS